MARNLVDAEAWFVAHGLPYFVDEIRDDVRGRMRRGPLTVVVVVALAVGVAAGVGTALWSGLTSVGVSTALTVAGLVLAAYAARALKASLIVRWALGRTFRSLGLLFPLATRALPMLLLFVTFLFINTEVWQVASALDGGVLWGAVLLFAAVAVGFLVVRLDEELDAFDDEIDGPGLVAACRGTPFEDVAAELVADGKDLSLGAEVRGLQKVNLVLVLLVSQIVQVLLLSLAVFVFFVVFGAVAIDDLVIESWIGTPPTYPLGGFLVSRELTQVATFLAAFSGLYFTVYAVTDAVYRKEFFTRVTRELERAVNARVAYRRMLATPSADGRS
jgi:hypothetical protein